MSDKLKKFAPSWPSVIMGTGALTISLSVAGSLSPVFTVMSGIFLILTLVISAVILVLWIVRLLLHPGIYREEILHPVAGSFLPTMPISLIIIAIAMVRTGPGIFGIQASMSAAVILFWTGTAGIYIFSWIIIPLLFSSKAVIPAHATFGWYIPPVSHLIIPVLGFELLHLSGGLEGFPLMYIVSLISLGTGIILFLMIGPNVFHRYLYTSSPSDKMAPTVLIGLAPTAILSITAVKLNMLLSHAAPADPHSPVIWIAVSLWGASMWWLILSAIKIISHIVSNRPAFALSWWALTFPFGTAVISTGSVNSLLHLPALSILLLVLITVFIILWTVIILLTVKGIKNRTIF